MKFIWPAGYKEEIRQTGYQAGYQEGYAAMHEIALKALNGYYLFVANIVKIQELDLGPVPSSVEDPKLLSYLDRVLNKIMFPYFLYRDAKKRIEELEAALADKERAVDYWKKFGMEATSNLEKVKSQSTSNSEKELKKAQEQNSKFAKRIEQLEEMLGKLQNAADWNGNNPVK